MFRHDIKWDAQAAYYICIPMKMKWMNEIMNKSKSMNDSQLGVIIHLPGCFKCMNEIELHE